MPTPVSNRKLQKLKKERPRIAVAKLKIVTIQSATSSVARRPYRSENFPCTSEPIMKPIRPLETSRPAWLGARCHGFVT